MDKFEKVVTDYQEVAEGEIDINTLEPVRKMFVKLTDKHSESIKDRLRTATLEQQNVAEDEDRAATIAQMLSGCTGFAIFVMAEYIKTKYKDRIDKKDPDFESYYFHGDGFSDIFNTYPGELIFGITQQEIDNQQRQNLTDPDYMNYTFRRVGLQPGLNLVQVCTKSTNPTLKAFGFFPVHTFLVYLEEENDPHVSLASSWFSGEATDPHTPPDLISLDKTEIDDFLDRVVNYNKTPNTDHEESVFLNNKVKLFFGEANSFNFGTERTFEVFVFNEDFFSIRLELLERASGGYRKMKKRKRKSTLKRRKRHSTKRKNEIK